jgi:hypothetical protein
MAEASVEASASPLCSVVGSVAALDSLLSLVVDSVGVSNNRLNTAVASGLLMADSAVALVNRNSLEAALVNLSSPRLVADLKAQCFKPKDQTPLVMHMHRGFRDLL